MKDYRVVVELVIKSKGGEEATQTALKMIKPNQGDKLKEVRAKAGEEVPPSG